MRIALVYTAAKPSWVSARTIRENLRRAWLGVDAFSVIDCSYAKNQNWSAWANNLRNAKPDIIVFLESMPVPVKAVGSISKIKSLKAIPFIFHIYGDFSINTHKWNWMGLLLHERRVIWLTASAAQHGQLTQFLNPGADVRCVPFPVDGEFYNPFSLRTDDSQGGHRFLYTGRFSHQKNTLLLLEWASEYLQKNSDVSFDFAGPFDDMGGGLWGLTEPDGWTASKWRTTLKKLPANVRARVRHHGNLPPGDVRSLAIRSDCYVSLSTHHDEDFGMAPLESLMCGSRAILSGWGGFSSFAVDADSVEIIPVKTVKDRITLNKRHFFSALDNVIETKRVSIEERYLRHLVYSAHFGIGAVSDMLKNMLHSPFHTFTGFSVFMQLQSDLVLKHWMFGGLVYKCPGSDDPVYERVYRSYSEPALEVLSIG